VLELILFELRHDCEYQRYNFLFEKAASERQKLSRELVVCFLRARVSTDRVFIRSVLHLGPNHYEDLNEISPSDIIFSPITCTDGPLTIHLWRKWHRRMLLEHCPKWVNSRL
jgi:hypothetical protein